MKVYDFKKPSVEQVTRPSLRPIPKTKSKVKRTLAVIVVILAMLAGGSYWFISHILSHTKGTFANGQSLSVNDFLAARNISLSGQSTGRTNIMIYGLTADGLRTDTMILASYYWQKQKLVMLNIPRDLYASYDGHDTKIVSLYAIAKDRQPTNKSYPPQYVSDFINKEYGISVDYWVVLNMQAFVQMVDSVGGVTINVDHSFTDCLYPNADYSGYIRPCPHFNAGIQTMDGATALIYARSRHSTDPVEGTDFARSKRQQVIIEAVLAKLKQQGVLTDLTKLDSYLQIFSNNVFTNLTPAELIKSAQLTSTLNSSQDMYMANWSNDIGFLCDSTDSGGSYVLKYGVIGNCNGVAGINDSSPYRQQAINYVQNLLQSAKPKNATSTETTATPTQQ